MLNYLTTRKSASAVPLYLFSGKASFKPWLKDQSLNVQNWVAATGFQALAGEICCLPDAEGRLQAALAGVTDLGEPWQVSKLPSALPKTRYSVETSLTSLSKEQANAIALGWALGTYRFDRYKSSKRSFATLVWPNEADRARVEALVTATGNGRDWINTPAEDMTPQTLAQVAREMAEGFGASYREVVGEALLEQNYPCIHAVGRAAAIAPRLIDFTWGSQTHPKVTLVGKGVCFDSGGLDLKPAEAMKLMKKDMGGAATVLAVASAVMQLGLALRLRVLIPAVENAVSGNAFRPLDVLRTRKGLTVEVGHTDAEGRLVLGDALAEADEEAPELLIDVATLTGAARVALGTGLPALFSSSDEAAAQLMEAGTAAHDPLWRLPLHRPYRRLLDSKVANLSNVSNGPYAGAITAALFLQEFVTKTHNWMHIDTMAFNIDSQPGRPYGGEVFGLRALVEHLSRRYPPR